MSVDWRGTITTCGKKWVMTIAQESKKYSIFRKQKLKHLCTFRMLLDMKNEMAVRPPVESFSCCAERSVITIFFYYLFEWV